MIDPEIARKANEARALQDNPEFQSVVDEIVSRATNLFLDPNCDTTGLIKAHEGPRAVQVFMDVIKLRLNDEAVAKKKDQHRGSD